MPARDVSALSLRTTARLARVVVPAVVAAKEPGELGRGMEAVAGAHRVHVEGPLASRDGVSARVDAGEDGSPHPLVVVALDPNENVPVEHRNAAAREGGAIRDSLPDEPRSVAKRGKGRAGPGPPAAEPSPLPPSTSTPPAASSHAHLEVERPVAGDEHPRAPGPTRYARARVWAAPVVMTPGSAQPGYRMRPFVGPGGDDELARAVSGVRSPVHDDLHFRRRSVRARPPAPSPTRSPSRETLHTVAELTISTPAARTRSMRVGPARELPIARPGRGEAVARGRAA